uniref:Uncharacterized protein n=1 Tax=Oryza meridionalis TaxID=40149 RepID=A0A0E0EA24_9ORYZ
MQRDANLSGNVIEQTGRVYSRFDLVCVATERSSCYVLNPATGAVYNLPVSPAEEHVYHVQLITPAQTLHLICIWACCFHGRVHQLC